jgi:ABC-type cobalt transport system substrate-binding protein
VQGTKRTLWEAWIDRNVDIGDPTPLFATESSGNGYSNDDAGLRVELTQYGRTRQRPVLRRSDAMDRRLRDAIDTVVEDHRTRSGEYDGLLYLMYALEDSRVVPYYIGKTGTFRRADAGLSANLDGVSATGGKFARWGYGNAYHIGDLSAAVLDDCDDVDAANHEEPKAKYEAWATRLFEPGTRRLRRPIYIWIREWDRSEGPYPDTYPFLVELEYQLVGIAYELFPETLLNTEGVPNNPTAYARMRGWVDDGRTSLDDFGGSAE